MLGTCTRAILKYVLTIFLTISWGQFFWMAYGWSIYFSPKNDCYDHGDADTAGWLIFFILILWQGLFFMLWVLIITCMAVCCMTMLRDLAKQANNK
jgi:hypothetical protein